jgi:hypothetical protein
LLILPAIKPIFAAYHLKVPSYFDARECLDFPPILGLNVLLDAFDIQRRRFSGMDALI